MNLAPETLAPAGLRFDGVFLGQAHLLQFTDIDPRSPAHGGSFVVNLIAERDAQRRRFEAGHLPPGSPESQPPFVPCAATSVTAP